MNFLDYGKLVFGNSISRVSLLQIATMRVKNILNKEDVAEYWCFQCKYEGELIICEYEQVLFLRK